MTMSNEVYKLPFSASEIADRLGDTRIYSQSEEPINAPEGSLWIDLDEEASPNASRGIEETTFNDNGSLTITYTDGESVTTPSIIGPQGEAGIGIYVWEDTGNISFGPNNELLFNISTVILPEGRKLQVGDILIEAYNNIIRFGKVISILEDYNGFEYDLLGSIKTPIKGTDYFTTSDVTEMVSSVKAAMPTLTVTGIDEEGVSHSWTMYGESIE